MIDYDATIRKTLISVAEFLERRAVKALDKQEYSRVIKNAAKVRDLANNPRALKTCMWDDANGFVMNGSYDNTAYLAFNDLLMAISKFYTDASDFQQQEVQGNLLRQVKRWNYIKSDSLFKGFYYPFMSPKKFAVNVDGFDKKSR